jgi:carbohydrate diacid regulator
MVSSQILQTAIDELRAITRIDLSVLDLEGRVVVTTFDEEEIPREAVKIFTDSEADSQVIQGFHFSRWQMTNHWNIFSYHEGQTKTHT